MRFSKLGAALAGGLAAMAFGAGAMAQTALETLGIPSQDGLGFQAAATPVMEDVIWLDNFLLYIITAIVLFVTALIAIVVIRFGEDKNPVPQRFTHNAVVEVLWTVIPIIILVVIAVPSLKLLNKQLIVPEAAVTIKATGNQWYWSYEYPDAEFGFDALMVGSGFATWEDLQADENARAEAEEYGVTRTNWRLETDNAMVVPAGKVVRMQVTGADVIHSWAIPAFGVKIDAVPGRLNETWFQTDKPGIYYGQCSELCGKNHAYMPITVHVVSEQDYAAWLETAQDKYAAGPREPRTIDVAAAE
jgi:cytochrome c oxidase subunit 2